MRPFRAELSELELEDQVVVGVQLGELLGFKLGPIERFSERSLAPETSWVTRRRGVSLSHTPGEEG